jgi:hypothetical protein
VVYIPQAYAERLKQLKRDMKGDEFLIAQNGMIKMRARGSSDELGQHVEALRKEGLTVNGETPILEVRQFSKSPMRSHGHTGSRSPMTKYTNVHIGGLPEKSMNAVAEHLGLYRPGIMKLWERRYAHTDRTTSQIAPTEEKAAAITKLARVAKRLKALKLSGLLKRRRP